MSVEMNGKLASKGFASDLLDKNYHERDTDEDRNLLPSKKPFHQQLEEVANELKESNRRLAFCVYLLFLLLFCVILFSWLSINDIRYQHSQLESSQKDLGMSLTNLSSSVNGFVKIENGGVFLAPKGLRIGHFRLMSEFSDNFVIRPDFPDGGDYRYAFSRKKFVDL